MADERRTITLIGGGGHALVVADAAAEARIPLAGFLDDATDAPVGFRTGLARLGGLFDMPSGPWIIAVGDIHTRHRLIDAWGKGAAITISHPSAIVSRSAEIGAGVFIGPHAVINPSATIDRHAIINTGAIVEHECRVGENSHIAPGAVLGGNVRIGAETLIGLGARVLPGLTIGSNCTIGAGAVVVRDVVDGRRVMGVPAKG